MGQAFSPSSDTELTMAIASNHVGQPGLLRTVDRCARSLRRGGRSVVRLRVECDQLPVDDRRCGENSQSGVGFGMRETNPSCSRTRSSGVENGTVREEVAL